VTLSHAWPQAYDSGRDKLTLAGQPEEFLPNGSFENRPALRNIWLLRTALSSTVENALAPSRAIDIAGVAKGRCDAEA
jgi:hypothetical protein